MCRIDRVLLLFLWTAGAAAAPLPEGALFTALGEEGWQIHISSSAGILDIDTAGEPRTPAVNRGATRIAYISSSGALREITFTGGAEHDVSLLEADDRLSYSQPAYGVGDELYVVVLKEGSSADTDIAVLDRSAGQLRTVVGQRSAQFEPQAYSEHLYYGSVSCTASCGRVIQDLWRLDRITGRADQLTMLNGVSRQPFAGPHGVYFASNAAGHFHIWRLSPQDSRPVRLTSGRVADTQPIVTPEGVYFLRTERGASRIMHMSLHGGEPAVLALESNVRVKDLRYGGAGR